MARPLRIELPGAFYHITSRAEGPGPIFRDEMDRQIFLNVCGGALHRHEAALLAYCLMEDHYHLVLHTRRANLSKLLRQLNGVYTRAHNDRHRKAGRLFRVPVKAILVDPDACLLPACRHVELNPVRTNMAANPGDWKWSSYRTHIGKDSGLPWLDSQTLYDHLLGRPAMDANDALEAATRYEQLVEREQAPNLWQTYLRHKIYLGDAAFATRMQALLPPRRRSVEESMSVDGQQIGTPIGEYFQNWTRNKAIVMAYEEGRYTLAAIARVAGLSIARVSKIIAVQKLGRKS
ncbi:MAG: transposase [Noviherbaspirillum sp.]